MRVSLERGKHGTPYRQKEMEKLIFRKLRSVGFFKPGKISAYLGKKVRGNPFRGKTGVTVPPTGLRGNLITFVVQACDNGTCFECHVSIPGEKKEVDALFNKLRESSLMSAKRKLAPIAEPRIADNPTPLSSPALSSEKPEHPDSESVAAAKQLAPGEVPQPPSGTAGDKEFGAPPVELSRPKLEVAEFLNDETMRQCILFSLLEKEREAGSFSGSECITSLMAAVGGQCSRRQFVPFLEQLIRRKFLKEDPAFHGTKKRYILAGKARAFLKSEAIEPKKEAPPKTPLKKVGPKERTELFKAYLKLEEKLSKLQAEESEQQKRLAEIQSAIKRLLKKKEDIGKEISSALKR